MRSILAIAVLGLCCAPLSAAECERPELSPFDAQSYYRQAERRQGEALHKALNAIIATPFGQPLECAPTALGTAQQRPARVWPKERGFPLDMQDAYADLHNLLVLPAEVSLQGGDSEAWRVSVNLRGDIARALLYMDVRYDGEDASLTPDLQLVEPGVHSPEPRLGRLCSLLQWHQDDPVTNAERERNERLYRWQGNRNPFVDHPEFAAAIWAKTCARPPVRTRILNRIETLEAELQQLKTLVEEAFP